MKSLLINLALLLVSTLLTLFALEGFVRIVMPQQLIIIRPDIWIPDENGFGWRQAANVNTTLNTGERTVRFVTDANGNRIDPAGSTNAEKRILVIGDSFLAAVQVEYADSIPGQLEKLLAQSLNEPVQVVNTAVGGWGPGQYLRKMRTELASNQYDLALVFLYTGNDILVGLEDYAPPKQNQIRRSLRLPQALTKAEIIDAWLYPFNDFFEERSHLYTLVKNRTQFLLMRLGLSRWYFAEPLLTAEAGSPRWADTTEMCARMAEAAAAHNTPVLFILLPADHQVDPAIASAYMQVMGITQDQVDLEQPSRLLSAEFAQRSLPLVDLLPKMRAAHTAGEPNLYGKIDTHLAPAGHRLAAETLLPLLLPYLQANPTP